jgi:hypothetical protein
MPSRAARPDLISIFINQFVWEHEDSPRVRRRNCSRAVQNLGANLLKTETKGSQ